MSLSVGTYRFSSTILPDSIILDTSFILELLHHLTGNSRQPIYFKTCEEFAKKLVTQKVKIYLSEWVLQEAIHKIIVFFLENEITKLTPKEINRIKLHLKISMLDQLWPILLHENNPKILDPIKPILENIRKELMKLCININTDSCKRIRNRVFDLIYNKYLLPCDAYITSSAIFNKIDAIATCDTHFLSVNDSLAVFLPDRLCPVSPTSVAK